MSQSTLGSPEVFLDCRNFPIPDLERARVISTQNPAILKLNENTVWGIERSSEINVLTWKSKPLVVDLSTLHEDRPLWLESNGPDPQKAVWKLLTFDANCEGHTNDCRRELGLVKCTPGQSNPSEVSTSSAFQHKASE